MKKLSTLFLLIFICCSTSNNEIKSKLLFNAKIVDVNNGSIQSNKAILIENDRIVAIGESEDLKSKLSRDQMIDLNGRYVIPGLWDAHVHIDKLSNDFEHSKSMMSLYTLNGVTSIREMGGDWPKIKALKEASTHSKFLPRVYTAGPIFENKAYVDWIVENDNDIEFGKQRIRVSQAEQVPFLIDSVLKLGVDFIKIRTAASKDVFFKIAEECRKHNVKFCGHVDAKVDLYEAVESGISSLEHVDIFQLSGMTETRMDSIVSLMKELNTAYSPTLIYFKQHRIYDKSKIKSFLNDSLYGAFPQRAFSSKSLLDKSKQAIGWAEESSVPWKKMEPNFLKFGKKIAKNKGLILASTDGANALVLPGFSLHEELMLMKNEFSMDNLYVLQSATINPAKYFGFKDQGQVKEGFIADLVILDKNPLEDLNHISSIYGVMQSGEYIDQGEIIKRLKEIQKYNKNQK